MLTLPYRLDQEEEKVLGYITAERPELVDAFVAGLERGRKGILHRLLQAVIRENIAGWGKRTSWQSGGKNVLQVALPSGRRLLVPVLRTHSLGRFDLSGEVVLADGEASETIEHPVRLLDLLREEGLPQGEEAERAFRRFREEIQNSVANYALALAGFVSRKAEMVQQAAPLGMGAASKTGRPLVLAAQFL
jgi:siderophore synthetase component